MACVACGRRDAIQRTAESAGEYGDESPAGLNCSAGLLHGTLVGHWASVSLDAQPTNVTRAWECVPREACLGGLESGCRDGHEGMLCAKCNESHYLSRAKLCVPYVGAPPDESAFAAFALLQLIVFGLLGCCLTSCCWFRATVACIHCS